MSKLITEFVGTLLLTLTVSLAITQENVYAPMVIGFTLIALVYMGGQISGAMYNPAVSLCLLITKNLSTKRFVAFVIVQFAGAIAGAYLANALNGKHPALAPTLGTTLSAALLCEAVFTAMLCLVILNVAFAKGTQGNQYYGVAIGLAVLGAAALGGPISGAGLNPAVALGLEYVNADMLEKSMNHVRLYTLGPSAGAIIAAIVFRLQKAGENG